MCRRGTSERGNENTGGNTSDFLPSTAVLSADSAPQTVDIVIAENPKPEHPTNTDALLRLQPKEYVVGMGCKRGIKPQKIETLIGRNPKDSRNEKEQIFALASIDKKQDEQGIFNLEQTAQSTVFDLYGKRTAKSAGKLSCLCFCRVTGWGGQCL